MNTITVENEKIRVTVPVELYNDWKKECGPLEQNLPSGDIRYHDPDKQTRGMLLSHAMKILGNQYEAMQLDNEPFEMDELELSIIAAEAVNAAKNSYIE